MKMAHAEVLKILPVLAPVDIVATATGSSYIDIDQVVGLVEFEVNFGAVTSTDSSGEATVTIEGSTGGISTDTNTALAFQYALSEAVNTDSMGAITAATSAGVSILSSSDDNKTLLCYLDPAVLKAGVTDGRYARVYIDPSADPTSTVVSVVARFTPRYSQASIPSST